MMSSQIDPGLLAPHCSKPPAPPDPDVEASELEALIRTFPLSERWSRPELFSETTRVSELVICVAGLIAKASDGAEVTGSAAALDAVPLRRAYFELLERASTLDAFASPQRNFRVYDELGRSIGECPAALIFPRTGLDASFCYSLSNGVAARTTFAQAARAAFQELVERDRVLRSWFGESSPVRLRDFGPSPLSSLGEFYELAAYTFSEDGMGPGNELEVAAVFGFPKTESAPLLRGTGAGRTRQAAVERAIGECIQALGFLWGETIPQARPTFARTADYHQEFFLWPPAHRLLSEWLERGRAEPNAPSQRPPRQGGPRFADLTPRHLRDGVHVLRAIPDCEFPLVFGRGHPLLARPLATELEVHPVA